MQKLKRVLVITLAILLLQLLAGCGDKGFDTDSELSPERLLEVKNANNIMCGYFAFDENYHYFKDITGDNGIYRKDRTTGEIISLYKLPNTVTNGFLHSISVWNERIYFVSSNPKSSETASPESDVMMPPVAYSMKNDGSDLQVVVENVGDTCYAINDALYYTTYKENGEIFLLHRYDLLTKKYELLIDTQSEYVNITDKGIYYINLTPMFYDFAEKKSVSILKDEAYKIFGRMLQYDNKLYFFGSYPESNGSTNEGYIAYDLNKGQAVSAPFSSKTTDYEFFTVYKNELLFHTFGDEKPKNELINSYHKKVLNAFDGKNSREIFTKKSDTDVRSYQFMYSDGKDLIIFSEGIKKPDYTDFETLPEIVTIDSKGKSTAYIPPK